MEELGNRLQATGHSEELEICTRCRQPILCECHATCGECFDPVRVIEILNPFKPVESRRESYLLWRTPLPVRLLLEAVGCRREDVVISLGTGEILLPEEDSAALVKPGSCVILAPRAAGGGIFRTIMSIAVLAAAIAIPFALPALGLISATSTAMLMAISSAVAIGGNLLISMFLAPSLSGTKDTGDTYDPTGPHTLAKPGTVIPKAYGTFQWGGNVISSFVDQEGSDDYLNCLVCYGFGPAVSFGEIQLNGKDISSYQNVTVQTRLGTNNQGVIQGFDKIENGFPQEIRLLNANGYVVVPGTGTNVQALEVTVKFVNGLIRYDDSGNPKQLSESYQVQYSPHGLGQWKNIISPRTTVDIVQHNSNGTISYPLWVVVPTDQFMGSGIVYASDSNNHTPGDPYSATQNVDFYDPSGNESTGTLFLQGEWQPTNPNLDQQQVNDWWGGYRVVTGKQTDPFYDTIKIYGLTAGQWDVRVLKYGSGPAQKPIQAGDNTDPHFQQDLWLWNINEIFFEDLAYPNMILVAVRALATNQLSGTDLNVLTTITHDIGVALPPQLQSFEHDNPAVVAYDMLMNPLYGAGQLTGYSVDIPAFVAWAQFNDQLIPDLNGNMIRRHVFAGVFDTSGDMWTNLQKVGTMSRAILLPVGTTLTVIIDEPVTNPMQIFTVGNTKLDSFKETWMAIDDRATTIEVEFADQLRNYRTDLPVSVIPPTGIQPGIVAKTTRVNLFGCTDRSRAWNWGYHKLLENQLLLRSAEIQASIEAVACRLGSVIGLQTDVTQWGVGGRILPGSTARSINIDRSDLPAFTPGQGWSLCVLHPALLRGTATITNIAGANITLNAAPAGRIVKLVTPDGLTETKVTNINGNVLTVASTTNFANGQVVSCYDQDVVETQLVESIAPNDGTMIQTTGGTSVFKAGIAAVVGASGIQYAVSVNVKNAGAAPMFIQDNYGHSSPAIQPGQSMQVNLSAIGNGVTVVFIWFVANSATDSLKVVASAPFVAVAGTGINLVPNPDFTGMVLFDNSVQVTLTQNQAEPGPISSNPQRVIVSAPFSQPPVPDAPWVYGQSAGACPAKLFRVQAIKQASDFDFTLSLLEYNNNVYPDDAAIIGNYLGTPDTQAQVSNLSVTENYGMTSGQIGAQNNPNTQQSRISVSWQNGPNTVGAQIYTQTDGSTWFFQGDSGIGKKSFNFMGTAGDDILIMVVGYDIQGRTAPFSTAPTITITVQGPSLAPPDVTGMQIKTATQIQTTGGTSIFKCYLPGPTGANGQPYAWSICIMNLGAAPVSAFPNYGAVPTPIQPGQSGLIQGSFVGNGVTDIQLYLVANSPSDSIDVIVFNPFVAPANGFNIFTGTQLTFSGMQPSNGANFTVTQGGAPGTNFPPAVSWRAIFSGVDHFELRYSPLQDEPWPDCSVIASDIPVGSSNTSSWIVPDVIGYYYLAAWNAAGVRSVHVATALWNNLPGNVGVGSGGSGPGGGGPGEGGGGPPGEPPPIHGKGAPPILTLAQIHTSAALLAAGASTPLNQQGSTLPTPDIPVTVTMSESGGVWTVTIAWSATTQPLPDTSTVNVPGGSATWTGLPSTATFYLYRFVNLSNPSLPLDTMQFVVPPGTEPDTAPNSAHAAAANADYGIGLSVIQVTTGSSSGSGGGSSGGGTGCPDGQEIVRCKELGDIRAYELYRKWRDKPASYVFHVQGENLKTAERVWRRIKSIDVLGATSWYMVAGHKISPHHDVRRDGKWQMPYAIGAFLEAPGVRVRILLEDTDFDEQNYILLGGDEELIIHNFVPNS